MKLFLGIDPGLDGALVAIDDAGRVVEFYDAPTISIEKNSRLRGGGQKVTKRREYDLHAMDRIVKGFRGRCDYIVAGLEKSQPMPSFGKRKGTVDGEGQAVGHGSIASFLLGAGWMAWRALLVSAGIPLAAEPAPVSWKSKMLADRRTDKGASRLAAMALFPTFAPHIQLVKHHGRAEAALLAEFCRRTTGHTYAPRPVTDAFVDEQVALAKKALEPTGVQP